MSDFLIFKAAFNNSATPAIGAYTAEGATALFTRNTSISPDYYLYNTALYSAVQWFVPIAETTDFEFVADILTKGWDNRITYFIIADSTGTTRLRMWSVNDNWHFENSDSTATTGSPEFIGTINPTTSGGFGVFHQFRVRVRKLTESSSSVEVYVDGTLKLTATAGAALITCAKIGFVGGVNSFGPGTGRGIKNAYVYDLSDGDVVNPGVLSGAFNRFINWMKSKFALKSDIPTVNNATLTIQKNGTNVQTFTANQSTNATANITVPTKTSDLTNDSGFITEDNTKIPLAGSNAISGSLIPATTDAYDLGSPSYQWNNAYIKSLTINGVACGDILTHNASEFVDVSSAQTIGGQKTFSHAQTGVGRDLYHFASNPYSKNTPPTNTSFQYIWFIGNSASQGLTNNWYGGYIEQRIYPDGSAQGRWLIRDTSESSLGVELLVNGNDKQFRPQGNNTIDLGTSTNKWKSFNGINPGALSLPSMTFISLDTTNFDATATTIGTFTPTVDGWAILSITQKNKPFGIWILNGGYRVTFHSVYNNGDYFIFALIPVRANLSMNIYCTADDIDSTRKIDWLRLFPCKGNV